MLKFGLLTIEAVREANAFALKENLVCYKRRVARIFKNFLVQKVVKKKIENLVCRYGRIRRIAKAG